MVELKKISALIVDDELNAINNLKLALHEHCPQVNVIGEAQTAKRALEILAFEEIEVLLLDIRLRNETGFDLLKQMGNYSGSIIFVTAHDEYGIQAIKFSATDYLLKPLDKEELINAIAKVAFKKKDRDREVQIDMLIQSFQQTKSHGQKRIALPEAGRRTSTIKQTAEAFAKRAINLTSESDIVLERAILLI